MPSGAWAGFTNEADSRTDFEMPDELPPPGFDVFLSHNGEDKLAVRRLKQRLVKRGLKVWLDEDELRPALSWPQRLEGAIRESRSVAVLLGRNGLGPWADEETAAALRLAVKGKCAVIPVLLPEAPDNVEVPLFLGNRTWVDLRPRITPKKLDLLVWGITDEKPGSTAPNVKRRQPGATHGIQSSLSLLDGQVATDGIALDLLTAAIGFPPGQPIPVSALSKAAGLEQENLRQEVPAALKRLEALDLLQFFGEHQILLRQGVDWIFALQGGHPRANEPTMARSLTLRGEVLEGQGDLQGARICHERALEIRRKELDRWHPEVADSLTNLGLVAKKQGDFRSARAYYEQVLEFFIKAQDPPGRTTALILNNLGVLAKESGDLKEARRCFESALEIQENRPDSEAKEKGRCLYNLGVVFASLGEPAPALAYLERALQLRKEVFEAGHPALVNTLAAIASVHHRIEDPKNSRLDRMDPDAEIEVLPELLPSGRESRVAEGASARSMDEQRYRDALAEECDQLSLVRLKPETSRQIAPQSLFQLSKLYVDLALTTSVLLTASESTLPLTPKRRYERQPALRINLDHRKVALVGRPGAGKSTFLQHLAHSLARDDFEALSGWPEEERPALPIFVKLRSFSHWWSGLTLKPDPDTLWLYLIQRLQKERLEGASTDLEAALKHGKAVLLLDGLDEVEDSSRTLVGEAVASFSRSYGNNRFILTSRPLSHREPLNGLLQNWPLYELASFDQDQVHSFLSAWYRITSPLLREDDVQYRVRTFKETVERAGASVLTERPLFLALIAWVYTQTGRLPEARSLVFERVLDLLLWHWEQGKVDLAETDGLSTLLNSAGATRRDLREKLDHIAFEIHRRIGSQDSMTGLRESDAWDVLLELHPSREANWAQQVLDTLLRRSELITTEPRGILQIPHVAFREHMAGAHLARKRNFGRTGAELLAQGPHWREPIRAAVSLMAHAEQEEDKEYEKPLALIDTLCPPPLALETEAEWSQIVFAGEALLEMKLPTVLQTTIGARLLDRVTHQLARLIASEAMPVMVTERTNAGDILGQLGDPRFDSRCIHLPCSFHGEVEVLRGFVPVPSGPFIMGSSAEDPEVAPDEVGNAAPLDIAYLFWIARYPVTVAQYGAFIANGGYEDSHWWSPLGWKWRKIRSNQDIAPGDPDVWLREYLDLRPGTLRDRPANWEQQKQFGNRPVAGVCWFEAMAYTNWLNTELSLAIAMPDGYVVRLPTEDEWEKVARFDDGRVYSWGGNRWDETRGNTVKSTIRHPTTVGIYPAGASALQIFDLLGNVMEWTITTRAAYPYRAADGRNSIDGKSARAEVILRGGSFVSDLFEIRCAARQFDYLHACDLRHGFRVVLSLPPEQLS